MKFSLYSRVILRIRNIFRALRVWIIVHKSRIQLLFESSLSIAPVQTIFNTDKNFAQNRRWTLFVPPQNSELNSIRCSIIEFFSCKNYLADISKILASVFSTTVAMDISHRAADFIENVLGVIIVNAVECNKNKLPELFAPNRRSVDIY